jgi:hypothetical protein
MIADRTRESRWPSLTPRSVSRSRSRFLAPGSPRRHGHGQGLRAARDLWRIGHDGVPFLHDLGFDSKTVALVTDVEEWEAEDAFYKLDHPDAK